MTRQPDLFTPRPRSFDEATLLSRLREVVLVPRSHGMTRAAIRRLMTPLPPITVPK